MATLDSEPSSSCYCFVFGNESQPTEQACAAPVLLLLAAVVGFVNVSLTVAQPK